MKDSKILKNSQILLPKATQRIDGAFELFINLEKILDTPGAKFVMTFLAEDNPSEWVCKTMNEIRQTTGLGRKLQERARDKLVYMGLLEEKVQGTPPKLHFKINWQALDQLICALPGQINLHQKEQINLHQEDKLPSQGEGNALNSNQNQFAPKGQNEYIYSCSYNNYNNNLVRGNNINSSSSFINNNVEFVPESANWEYPPDWVDQINAGVDRLYKTTTWRRYPHPTRSGVQTTIRQMIMDVVCSNRLRRFLYPTEDEVCHRIQQDLDSGRLKYEDFSQSYRRWEMSNVPRIGWLVKALYGTEDELKRLEQELERAQNEFRDADYRMATAKDDAERNRILIEEFKPAAKKVKELKEKIEKLKNGGKNGYHKGNNSKGTI